MEKQLNRNRGFSLVELLISMALLSIIMLMVVQFMSSTAGANKRIKDNLRAQTESKEVFTNISDNIMAANYLRISPDSSKGTYLIAKSDGSRKESYTGASVSLTQDKGTSLDFDFVPDSYGNYLRKDQTSAERKAIVDLKTYQILGEDAGDIFPCKDNEIDAAGADVRSFRTLKQTLPGSSKESYIYVQPKYIYAEYIDKNGKLHYIIYRFDYSDGKIYLYRSPEGASITSSTTGRYSTAKSAVDALSGDKGLLSDHMVDFYVSADADGNAIMMDALFNVKGYQYNSVDTVTFRNTEVLTVRPQNLYKKYYKDSSTTPSSEGGSSENPSEGSSSEEGSSEESSGGDTTTP